MPQKNQGQLQAFNLGRLSSFFLTLYLLLHLILPFRHLLYPHSASWSEEGHQFSWRMMLRTKNGETTFVAQKEDGKKFVIDPLHYLTPRQFEKMKGYPDMLLQFAHFLAAKYQEEGVSLKIFCYTQISLNNHPPRPLIDPSIDLVQVSRSLKPYSFILPGPSPYFKDLAISQ